MYPRMHKILGMSIEDFLTHMYYYGQNIISSVAMAKFKVLNDFRFIQYNGSSMTEEEIIAFEKECRMLRGKFDIINELYTLFETYSHTEEYNKIAIRSDIDHLREYCKTFYSAGDNDLKWNSISRFVAKTAMEFGVLDESLSVVSENHPNMSSDRVMVSAYNKWTRSQGVKFLHLNINYLRDVCPDMDTYTFLMNIDEEMKYLFDFICYEGYIMDTTARFLILGKDKPTVFDDFLNIYANHSEYSEINRAMNHLNVMAHHVENYEKDDSLKERVRSIGAKWRSKDELFLTASMYLREIITFDGLNFGYLDQVPSSKKVCDAKNKKARSFMGGAQLNVDVCHYLDSKLSPEYYPSFVHEYFYENPGRIRNMSNNAKVYHEFLSEKYHFSEIPKEKFKSWRDSNA